MSPRRKKTKVTRIIGSSIRYNESSNSYMHDESYISFGQGEHRVYEVPEAFLTRDISFEVISEVNRVITVGNPKSISGNLSGQGIQVAWVMNRFDKKFMKRCDEFTMSLILKRLGERADSECLRGISYKNQYSISVQVHMDGVALNEICKIMGYEPRPLYARGADILNKRYRGHRENGDSLVRVSTIPQEDLPVYMILVKEKIMRAQKIDGKEYLITKEVDDAEETLVRSLHELSRRFEAPEVEVTKEFQTPEDSEDSEDSGNTPPRETLIEEQMEACSIAMNNPVSYLCGMPGVGKTSTLCKIMRDSDGVVVLTPSHVSREVVYRRALDNGVSFGNFSVEVTSFAVLHVQEWMPNHMSDGEHQISQRSRDFMEKFIGEDGSVQIETLVLEEASMIDIFTASSVIEQFCQIPSLKRILLCGDHRQLASVGKGRVLQDVMECRSIPGKVLVTNHRSGNALSANLKHILSSSMIHIDEDETFEVVSVPLDHCEVETDKYGRDRVLAIQPMVDIYRKHMELGLPTHAFGYTHVEINQINEAIKTSLFGEGTVMFPDGCKVRVKDPEIISPAHFHRNDFIEIVQNKGPKNFVVKRWNNKGVQEGEEEEEVLYDIKVTGRLKEALTLGYTSSIHAFQGSEAPYVIVHGIPNCAYFDRDSLYTGCSRGKSSCTVVTCNQARFNWKKIVYKRATGRLSNLSRRF